jgi:hypothetical protein
MPNYCKVDVDLLREMSITLTEVMTSSSINSAERDERVLRIASELCYISIEAAKPREPKTDYERFLRLLRDNGYPTVYFNHIIGSVKDYMGVPDGSPGGGWDVYIEAFKTWQNTPGGKTCKSLGKSPERERFVQQLQDKGYGNVPLNTVMDSMKEFMGVVEDATLQWQQYNNHFDEWHQTARARILRGN